MKKNKYLTFSFDDCEIYDRILCDMFRKYGMKATFFLISDQLGIKCDFHRYGEDTIVERVSPAEISTTYAGMEVASHTANHSCPVDDLKNTVLKSAKYLSELCGYEVKGMAYPGGWYSEGHVAGLKKLGIQYARTVRCTNDFAVPTEWLAWHPTCKYDDEGIGELIDSFLDYDGEEPAVFHIYGHSYEMTRKEKGCSFTDFEELLKRLSGREDIVYATNMEIREVLGCTE